VLGRPRQFSASQAILGSPGGAPSDRSPVKLQPLQSRLLAEPLLRRFGRWADPIGPVPMPNLVIVLAHLRDSGKTEERPVSAIDGAHALSGVVVDDAVANCSVAGAVVEQDVVRRKRIIVVDRPVVDNFCSLLQRRDIGFDHRTEASHAARPPSQFWLRENGFIFQP